MMVSQPIQCLLRPPIIKCFCYCVTLMSNYGCEGCAPRVSH